VLQDRLPSDDRESFPPLAAAGAGRPLGGLRARSVLRGFTTAWLRADLNLAEREPCKDSRTFPLHSNYLLLALRAFGEPYLPVTYVPFPVNFFSLATCLLPF